MNQIKVSLNTFLQREILKSLIGESSKVIESNEHDEESKGHLDAEETKVANPDEKLAYQAWLNQ